VTPKADTLFFAPVAAALAGWMLSGSPVPMGLTVLILVLALIGGLLTARWRPGPLAAPLPALILCAAACTLEVWLFREGRALVMRADMPAAYHVGIGLLWWASADRLLRPAAAAGNGTDPAGLARAFAAVGGGLILLAASAGTVLYDFGPWEAHPVAALPLALWGGHLVLPAWPLPRRLPFATLPASLLLTALVLGSIAATDTLRPWFTDRDDTRLDALAPRAPELDGNGPLGDGASRKIPRDVDVRFRREILVRVKAHSPALYRAWAGSPLYLRSSTLALFESDEVLSPIRSGRWLYDQDDGEEDRLITLDPAHDPASQADPARLHTCFIDRKSVSHLPLVENVTALYSGSVYEFADDWYQFSPADEIQRIRYTATVASPAPLDLRASDLRAPASAEIPAIYLQLPPSPLSTRVRELCATFSGDTPLASIRAYLARQAHYSLHFSTPGDSSPLAEFLFGDGHGHCEHYAAATVLLLRGLGIPSRVAYGYAGGIADPGQRLFAFRDSDFHAWAEVLTPDRQWKRFDTTPVVPNAAPRVPSSSALPPMVETEFHDFSEFDPTTVRRRNEFAYFVAGLVDWFSRHFFVATAAGLGLLGGLWRLLLRRRGSGGPGRSSGERDPSGAVRPPDFLIELARIAEAPGGKRRPGQTWRELLARLDGCEGLPPAAGEAVDYHYHITYAGGPRDPAAEARFLEALRGWTAGTRPD
jgi:transglutaminase-like putative cysteine protease